MRQASIVTFSIAFSVNTWITTVRGAKSGGSNGIMGHDGVAKEELIRLACICKNRGFREECEYRILMRPGLRHDGKTGKPVFDVRDVGSAFRLTRLGIVPYHVFSFPTNSITEITLGPKNYARQNREALGSFLNSCGYSIDEVRITEAEATYQ